MRPARLALAITLPILLMLGECLLAQADDSEAQVDLRVEVVAAPSVSTCCAWPVGWHSAVLNGRLTGMGADSSVKVYFEWGETTAYGSRTRARRMTDTGRFSAVIRGLTPGTTYHFRAVVEGEGSTGYGSDRSFKTRKHWCWW